MRVCPECGSASFMVTGIEYHDWTVDGDGNFLSDQGCFDSNIVFGTEWHCNGCEAVYGDRTQLKEVEQ